METKEKVKNEVYQISHVDIENSIKRCNSDEVLDGIKSDIEIFKGLGIGNFTDSAFKCILTGQIDPLRELWDEKIRKEVAQITTNPQIARGFIAEANTPFEEFEERLKKSREKRYSKSVGGECLDHFFKLNKGKVEVDEEAIKDHYTVYYSDDAMELMRLAKEAKAALDKVANFVKEYGGNLYKSPVLSGDLPFRAGPYAMPGDQPLFHQSEGKIHIRHHEIAEY